MYNPYTFHTKLIWKFYASLSLLEKENKTLSLLEKENKTQSLLEKENKTQSLLEKENNTQSLLEKENKTLSLLEKENKTSVFFAPLFLKVEKSGKKVDYLSIFRFIVSLTFSSRLSRTNFVSSAAICSSFL